MDAHVLTSPHNCKSQPKTIHTKATDPYLITTHLEDTWPSGQESRVFLGRWCLVGINTDAKTQNQILPYIWDDRQRLAKDFETIQSISQKYLHATASALNVLHQSNYSIRFWDIALGNFIDFITGIAFERWHSLANAASSLKSASTIILNGSLHDWRPQDMAQIGKDLEINPYLNHLIYKTALETGAFGDTLACIPQSKSMPIPDHCPNPLRLKDHLTWIARYLPKTQKHISFSAPYFSPSNLWKLQLKLKQIPNFGLPRLKLPHFTYDAKARKGLQLPDGTPFEAFLSTCIKALIPCTFVEGFSALKKMHKKWFPERPASIVTANSHLYNDLFKIWAAECTESGAKLYIHQHGGHFGTGLFCAVEQYERRIANNHLSWGWSDEHYTPNVQAITSSKLISMPHIESPPKNGTIFMVSNAFPIQSYRLYSIPIAAQTLETIDDQVAFSRQLDIALQKRLLIRMHPANLGWDEKRRFQNQLPDHINIYQGNIPFHKQLQKSAICICPYNLTTPLEVIHLNWPTLMFWDPKHWELREAALPYYERLRKAKILHDSPESAANHLNGIQNRIEEWWRSEEVQLARSYFQQRFAYTHKEGLNEWAQLLQSS